MHEQFATTLLALLRPAVDAEATPPGPDEREDTREGAVKHRRETVEVEMNPGTSCGDGRARLAGAQPHLRSYMPEATEIMSHEVTLQQD